MTVQFLQNIIKTSQENYKCSYKKRKPIKIRLGVKYHIIDCKLILKMMTDKNIHFL